MKIRLAILEKDPSYLNRIVTAFSAKYSDNLEIYSFTNQELALSAAEGIAGLEDVLVFSVGSDGTDGPTDAAGGMVDGSTKAALADKGLKIHQVLTDNDAYHALQAVDSLIITGPTGTNVNDVAVVLIRQ